MARERQQEKSRRCIASRESKPTAEMLRFVVGPDNTLVPDLAGRLPGRGIWLTAERDLLDLAVKKGAFAKAAKRKLTIPADLSTQVERILTRQVLDLLGLARRAGEARTGFEKVRALLKAGEVGVLIAASDGAADGRNKLRKLASAVSGDFYLLENLRSGELSLALGHENVVHAAVTFGGLAERIKREAVRLGGFRR